MPVKVNNEKAEKLAKEKQDTLDLKESSEYLASTDWYSVRYYETGIEIPSDVKTKRQNARDKISEIRGTPNNKKAGK